MSRLDPAQNCHGGPGIDVLQSSTNPYIGLSPHHLEHPIASQIGVLVANLFFLFGGFSFCSIAKNSGFPEVPLPLQNKSFCPRTATSLKCLRVVVKSHVRYVLLLD